MPKKDPQLTPITDLFAKYKQTLKAPQGSVVSAFVEVVQDLYELPLKRNMVRYSVSSRTITLIAPGPLKSELLLKKTEVLTHLKGRLGEKSAPIEIL